MRSWEAEVRDIPGRVFVTTPLKTIADGFGARLEVVDTGPRLDLAPGEAVAVLVADPVPRLVEMRWQMILTGRRNARGRPVMETIVNARAETVFSKSAYEGVRRAVLPVDGWYEWTGSRGRKTRWKISAPDRPVLAFAAIWDLWQGPGGVELRQMATLTVEPSADVADYHHRMPAILAPGDVAAWLAGEVLPLEPAPAGLLEVVRAEERAAYGPPRRS